MFSFTPVVRVLLIINVLVAVVTITGRNQLGELVISDAIATQFGLHSFLSDRFSPIQLLTHMFLHGGYGHLLGNMIGLVVFGPMLERYWGQKRFTFFYFFCGFGAALLFSGINYFEIRHVYEAIQDYRANPTPFGFESFLLNHAGSLAKLPKVKQFIDTFDEQPGSRELIENSIRIVNSVFSQQVDEPMIGASGAIFGVIMGFGLLFPNTQLFLLFPPIPVKAKYIVIFYGAYEVYSGLQRVQSDNVAHFAHIGGMLFAFILIKYWGSQRKTFY